MSNQRANSTRVLAVVVIAALFAVAWQAFEQTTLVVIGQPSITGLVQKEVEEPFYRNLAKETGLNLDVRYRPLDEIGYKDNYQLSMVRDGLIDLVSLRFLQNSDTEPSLLGVDLWGLNSDYETGKRVVAAYAEVLDQRLQARFKAKLLGIWPFGPQVFFCSKPIAGLQDIRGLKVRVGGRSPASFISALGGIPTIIAIEDVREALRIGLVDCALSSSGTANFAGWPEFTTHYFPLSTQLGLNGDVISLHLWNSFSEAQRRTLTDAFKRHSEAMWTYSEFVHTETSNCNVARACRVGKPYHLQEVRPTQADLALMRTALLKDSVRNFGLSCDPIHPGCSQEWQQRLGPIIGASP